MNKETIQSLNTIFPGFDYGLAFPNCKIAIADILRSMNIREIAIPTYTCYDVWNAVLMGGVIPSLIDCKVSDLQINEDQICTNSVIVTHTFGIRCDMQKLRENNWYAFIIEDCSQCIGLPNMGEYADVVVFSTGKSKWLDLKSGAVALFKKKPNQCPDYLLPDYEEKLCGIIKVVPDFLHMRESIAQAYMDRGYKLIVGNHGNAWHRGMMWTEHSTKNPFIPIHTYRGFKGWEADSFVNHLDWVSIWGKMPERI